MYGFNGVKKVVGPSFSADDTIPVPFPRLDLFLTSPHFLLIPPARCSLVPVILSQSAPSAPPLLLPLASAPLLMHMVMLLVLLLLLLVVVPPSSISSFPPASLLPASRPSPAGGSPVAEGYFSGAFAPATAIAVAVASPSPFS